MTSPEKIRKAIHARGFRLLWIVVLGSCLSPVEFKTENIGGTVVVSGQISTLEDQNIVQLGLTADTERLPLPLSGATVELLDDTGESFFYAEDFSNPGTYLLNNVSGIAQRTYHIRITTPEGSVYESQPEKMPNTAGEVTTNYEIVNEEYVDLEGIVSIQPFFKVYASSILTQAEETNYVKWNIDETFLLSPTDFPDPFGSIPPPCFVAQNADPQRVVLLNGEDINTTSINGLLVGSRIIDWTFLEKHAFTTYQSSMTKEAYEYWRKVNILANQVGSIFDTPPAAIAGNIVNVNNKDERVLGYFQAVNQGYSRFFVYPSDLPFTLQVVNCTYSGDRANYPARCLDCTSIRNSTYNRPDWF